MQQLLPILANQGGYETIHYKKQKEDNNLL
jgi:hypothetical protein